MASGDVVRLQGGITGPPSPERFQRSTVTTINGRHVTAGTELTIRGAGRCRFIALVHNPRNGRSWIDAVDHRCRIRSFTLESVTTVHRLAKTRDNAT